jgi:uncharacterized membrane protein YvbJ
MSTCPSCGRDNDQSEMRYCSFCGSNLQKEAATQSMKQSDGVTPIEDRTGSELSQSSTALLRLEKVTKKVEWLTYFAVAEAILLLVILIFFYYTIYG